MTDNISWSKRLHGDGLITPVAFGGFLIIVGLLFVLTPDLWQKNNWVF